MSFESTKWTSTSALPFGPAPGAGLAYTEGKARRPRRKATIDFESGFAAEPADEITFEDERIEGKWVVREKPVLQGQIASALVQLYFTDRGTLTQSKLDSSVLKAVKAAGFRASRAVKLEQVAVRWKWQHEPDFYYPVVTTPSNIAGLKYAGNALRLPVYNATSSDLAKLPGRIYVYTFAATSAKNTMTDAESAKLLSTLKASLGGILGPAGAYAAPYFTRLGSPPEVFEGASGAGAGSGSGSGSGSSSGGTDSGSDNGEGLSPAAKVGISALLLIVAVNMITPHIKAAP